jgi:hypothetical protein
MCIRINFMTQSSAKEVHLVNGSKYRGQLFYFDNIRIVLNGTLICSESLDQNSALAQRTYRFKLRQEVSSHRRKIVSALEKRMTNETSNFEGESRYEMPSLVKQKSQDITVNSNQSGSSQGRVRRGLNRYGTIQRSRSQSTIYF